MTLAWVLLAVALVVTPSARGRSRGSGDASRAADRAGGRASRALRISAVAGVGAACIALFGPGGALAAVVAAPLTWTLLGRVRSGAGPVPAGDVAIVLDLAAAALRAGRPPADALSAAAPAAADRLRAELDRVAGLLRLGAEPAVAWATVRDGPLAPVAVVGVRSAASGARLAPAFERLGVELRAESAAAATARASRAGVLALAPLGACFLPSFVLLGVVPVVVGVARSALDGLS